MNAEHQAVASRDCQFQDRVCRNWPECFCYAALRCAMQARIVDDLISAIEQEMPGEGHRTDPEFLALAERIQGRCVDLVFVGGDAFEAHDNNYWLPESCWVPA